MASRVIRDGFLDSEAINSLSAVAQVFFVRLMLVADDYGRADARPEWLCSKCYPIGGSSPTIVSEMVIELNSKVLIKLYKVENKNYLEIINFGQRLRTMKSKYPPPTDVSNPLTIDRALQQPADDCGSLQTTDGLNPIPNPILIPITKRIGKVFSKEKEKEEDEESVLEDIIIDNDTKEKVESSPSLLLSSPKGKREAAADPLSHEKRRAAAATADELLSGLPEGSPLRCEAFYEWWRPWVQHKKEQGKPLTKTSAHAQLMSLHEMGLEKALSLVRASVEGGWSRIPKELYQNTPFKQNSGNSQAGLNCNQDVSKYDLLTIPVGCALPKKESQGA